MSKCKITVLRREYYQDLADQYLADPQVGKCPLFKEGQEFILERGNGKDDFWNMMNGKFCSEAWDAVSRYIYAALQGGSIMKGWTNDEKMMIACCSDGTRPVIFKIERIDEMEENAAQEKGIETKIWAVGATEVKNHSQDADVILLGPQVRYLEKSIADDANGVPAYLIDMRDYGKMDGKAVLTFALNKLQEV